MLFGNPIVEIVVMCLALAIFSQLVSRRFRAKSGFKEQQELMKKKQKEMKELMKKDPSNTKEIEKLQKETMALMQTMMSGSYKQMFVTLPVFLVVYWLLGFFYGGQLLISPIAFPKLSMPDFGMLTLEMGYQRFYFFIYLILTIIIAVVLKYIDKAKLKNQNKGEEKKDKKSIENKKEEKSKENKKEEKKE